MKNSVEVPQKLNIDFPCDPEIGRRPKGPKAGAPIDPRAPLRMEGFLTTARGGGTPDVCQERVGNLRVGVHTAGCDSAAGREGVLIHDKHGGTWKHDAKRMSRPQQDKCCVSEFTFHFHAVPRRSKLTSTEGGRGPGPGRWRTPELWSDGYSVRLGRIGSGNGQRGAPNVGKVPNAPGPHT